MIYFIYIYKLFDILVPFIAWLITLLFSIFAIGAILPTTISYIIDRIKKDHTMGDILSYVIIAAITVAGTILLLGIALASLNYFSQTIFNSDAVENLVSSWK